MADVKCNYGDQCRFAECYHKEKHKKKYVGKLVMMECNQRSRPCEIIRLKVMCVKVDE
jgi:hypothetical protein